MPMQENTAGDDIDASGDEISFVDALKVMSSGWLFIVVSLAISLGAGWLYLSSEKPQFQAELVMTTGRVPTSMSLAPVEGQDETLLRVRSPTFLDRLSGALEWDDEDRERLLLSSLNITAYGQDAIQFSFRILNNEDAQDAIDAIERIIREQFQAIAAPIAEQNQSALQVVQARIEESEALLANIIEAYELAAPNDSSARAELLKLQRDVLGDLVSLRLQRSGLQKRLEPGLPELPAPLTEPSISAQPVQPVSTRVMAVAGFVGLSFGIFCCAIWALIRHMRRPMRTEASVA